MNRDNYNHTHKELRSIASEDNANSKLLKKTTETSLGKKERYE